MRKPINLVIFASREPFESLTKTIIHAARAIPSDSILDVIINGNKILAGKIHDWSLQNPDANSRIQCNIWTIHTADKGNAWNQHIHGIWNGIFDSIYIDGYVQINNISVSSIMHTFTTNRSALGTSGFPSMGRSAAQIQQEMRRIGGFHGNLCAIRSTALQQIRNRNIRIPFGMYRVDSIVGAFLSFGLNNKAYKWDPFKYIPVTETASWKCDTKKWHNPRDIIAWNKRRNRQAQGDLENAAVKYHLAELRTLPEELPDNVRDLILSWRDSKTIDAMKLVNRTFRHKKAMRNIENYSANEKEMYQANPAKQQ